MNKITKYLNIVVLVIALLSLFVSASGEYSSKDDPLVSLSYLEDIFGPDVMSKIIDKIDGDYVKITDISSISGGEYTPVSMTKGNTFMASSACEVIVLSGSSVAVVTSHDNVTKGAGLSDLTAGTVITSGTVLPENHYIVIPKSDGRGFTVTSDTLTVLVRGEYNITG